MLLELQADFEFWDWRLWLKFIEKTTLFNAHVSKITPFDQKMTGWSKPENEGSMLPGISHWSFSMCVSRISLLGKLALGRGCATHSQQAHDHKVCIEGYYCEAIPVCEGEVSCCWLYIADKTVNAQALQDLHCMSPGCTSLSRSTVCSNFGNLRLCFSCHLQTGLLDWCGTFWSSRNSLSRRSCHRFFWETQFHSACTSTTVYLEHQGQLWTTTFLACVFVHVLVRVYVGTRV